MSTALAYPPRVPAKSPVRKMLMDMADLADENGYRFDRWQAGRKSESTVTYAIYVANQRPFRINQLPEGALILKLPKLEHLMDTTETMDALSDLKNKFVTYLKGSLK